MKLRLSVWLHIYCAISGMYILIFFINAFLPLTDKVTSFSTVNDIPSDIGGVKVNVSDLYHSHVDRIILMVIDALRVDFIANLTSAVNMPYVHLLLKSNVMLNAIGNVQVPTVTMPRIKAMTTGTVPNFIDVIYNLGSPLVTEDNLIQQAENSRKSVIFYGDETWLKLFPNNFQRKEGTTSFFVADFTEVDNNVTQNLEKELKRQDWEVMILHYLGLDHIGHLEGPNSRLVKPKLLEMDNIIKNIHINMIEWGKKSSRKSVLVICGDHGMKDSGGHGGSTPEETTVPILVVAENYLFQIPSQYTSVSQIDLVSTLSVLLGLPIPKGNIGKLITPLLHKIPTKKRLFAYHYNAKQVVDIFKEIHSYQTQEAYLQYEEALRLHTLWLKSDCEISHYALKSEELYKKALEQMSEILRNSRVNYDILCLNFSICIGIQICAILIFKIRCINITSQIFIYSVLLSFLNVFYCLFSESESALCTYSIKNLLVIIFPSNVIFSINSFIIVNSVALFSLESTNNQALKWILIGSALHLFSLFSSSFIEEEHQVWYFLWLTFNVVVLWKQCQICYQKGSFKDWTIYSCILLAIGHRVLRKLNQTGDKWASLPDLSDWLLEHRNKGWLSLLFVIGLFGNYMCLWYWHSIKRSCFSTSYLILLCSSFVSIYLYRDATGSVISLFGPHDSRGFTEAMVFWCHVSLITLKIFFDFWTNPLKNKISIFEEAIHFFLGIWVLIITLLHRPQNVILPCFQICASFFLASLYKQTLKTKDDTRWFAIAHVWLGMVAFFYQGNSNSLATIDVASGYVGLKGYYPVLVGLFLIINTYSAPVLSILCLICHVIQEGKHRGIWLLEHTKVAFHILMSYRWCTVCLYLVLLTFQKHHLFVWSVFTPKLLYEFVLTFVQYFLILLAVCIIFTIHEFYSLIFSYQ